MAPRKKSASYDDVLALPEHLVGEIIDGELIVSPRPASAHTLAASGLGSELFGLTSAPMNVVRNNRALRARLGLDNEPSLALVPTRMGSGHGLLLRLALPAPRTTRS